MTISFSFYTVSQRIQPGDCFNLVCENPDTKVQLFLENNSFKYCFAKAKPKCNPLSKFKIENNECICSEPYTGK
jgi:sulfite reductase alpha subunit-like flavoprotein